MNIRFRRPAFTDVTVEVSLSVAETKRIAAEAEAQGKAEFILKTDVRDTDDHVVAETEGVYQLRKTEP